MASDIPADWFATWTGPDGGPQLRSYHSGLVQFYKASADEVCPQCGGTLRFLGYLWGCLDRSYSGRCGHWWQAWRCECGYGQTDGY